MANGGGGALEAQQQIAASIPYRNLAQRNPAEQFLSAFFTASQVGNQRRRLEEQLMKMDLDAKFKEQAHELGVARLETMAALQTAEHNRKMQGMENEMTRFGIAMDAKNNVQDWRERRDQETMEGTSALISSLHSMKSKPGDPDYYEELSHIAANPSVARALNTPLGRQLVKTQKEDHNLAVKRLIDANNASRRGFDTEVANTFGRLNYDMFIHPDWWIDTKDETTGKPMKAFRWKMPNENIDRWITQPPEVVDKYTKKYREIVSHASSIPPQINDDEVRAAPAGSQTSGLSPQDARMLDWARKNPGDPLSAQVKQRLGVE